MEQKGGGSYLQPMGGYIDGPAPVPAPAGGNLLTQTNDLFARPRIENTAFPPGGLLRGGSYRGGFFPSIMGGVVDAGGFTVPAAAVMARRMFSGRKGGSRKGNTWAAQRAQARQILERYGVPNGTNISAYASRYFEGRKKYNPANADRFLRNFQEKVRRGERKQERNRPSRQRRVATPVEATRRSGRTVRAPKRLTYPANYARGTRRVARPATPRSDTPPARTRRAAPKATATRSKWFDNIRAAQATLKQRGYKGNAVLAAKLASTRRKQQPNEAFFASMPRAAVVAPPRLDARTLLPPPTPLPRPAASLASVVTRTGRLSQNLSEERRILAKRRLTEIGVVPSAVNIQRYVKALKEGASRQQLNDLEFDLLYEKSMTKAAKKRLAARAAAAAPAVAVTQAPRRVGFAMGVPSAEQLAAPYEFIEPESE